MTSPKNKKGVLEVGLTGGIASGKSTVSRILSELGLFIIDADFIAHKMIEPDGKAFQSVLERFGFSILEGGVISRNKLAQVVFHNDKALQDLNEMIHPHVLEEIDRITQEVLAKGQHHILLTEAALLIETGYYKRYDKLIVVTCSQETQIKRLMERDNMDREEALSRINSQMPITEKIQYADYIIDTDCSLSEVRKKTEELYQKLMEDTKNISNTNNA